MRLVYLLLLFTLSFNIGLSQLVIDDTMTPTQLVQDVLVGSGVTVTGVNFSGNAQQIGYFDGTNSNVGFAEGIIISSGDVNNAIGPNDESGVSTGYGGPGDTDLNAVSGLTTNDAAVLSFDFVPSSSVVVFEYVFASDEYLEFANSSWNDAFGFFVSGPGINGPYTNNAINIALLPDGVTPVSINNVNDINNPAYYVDNGDGFTAPYSTNAVFVEFDGLTVVLRAEMNVTPCETYRLVLAVADGGDDSLDSGVFLKKGSLKADNLDAEIVVSGPVTGSVDPEIVEGCSSVQFELTVGGPVQNDSTIFFTTGGTATADSDYTSFGNSFTIPAGDSTLTVTIDALIDNAQEGLETLEIYLPVSACKTDTFTLNIIDKEYYPLVVSMPSDTAFCGASSLDLVANVTGGVGALSYSWDNGASTSNTYTVNPNSPTTYTLDVTDECGLTTSQTVDVLVGAVPNANAGSDNAICSSVDLVIGSPAEPGVTYSWSPTNGLDDPTIAQPTLNYLANGGTQIVQEYIVTANNSGCLDVDTVEVTISPVLTSSFTIDTTVCENEQIQVNYTGNATAGANYNWQFNNANVLSGSGAGPYTITFTNAGAESVSLSVDEFGCSDGGMNTNVLVTAVPVIDAGLGGAICSGEMIGIGDVATPGVTYSWTPVSGLSDPTASNPNATLVNTGNQAVDQVYYMGATENGCAAVDSVVITVNPEPVVTVAVDSTQCDYEAVFDFTSSVNVDSSTAQFNWMFDPSASSPTSTVQNPQSISFNGPGSYSYALQVTANGCTSSIQSGNVVVYESPTAAFDSTNFAACVPYTYPLNNASTGISNLTYIWQVGTDTYTDQNPSVLVDQAGVLDVNLVATSQEGCSDTVSYNAVLEGYAVPVAAFNLVDTLSEFNPNSMISDLSISGDSCVYAISNTSGWIDTVYNCTFEYFFPDTGWYSVKQYSFNANGCLDSTTQELYVAPEYVIYVPNAFSPLSSLGINDTWKPVIIGQNSYDLQVYNRWGELIFSTNDPNVGWNGQVNNTGAHVPEGVYVYILRTTNSYNDPIERMGHITLIR